MTNKPDEKFLDRADDAEPVDNELSAAQLLEFNERLAGGPITVPRKPWRGM